MVPKQMWNVRGSLEVELECFDVVVQVFENDKSLFCWVVSL